MLDFNCHDADNLPSPVVISGAHAFSASPQREAKAAAKLLTPREWIGMQ
jgi:hypothetical protein